MFGYAVAAEGFDDDLLDSLSDPKRKLAMVRALNTVARNSRAQAARNIRDEVNFPARYVSPSQGRLAVAQKATRGNPEAIIRARARASSLAQFLTGPARPYQEGVTVQVGTGQATFLRRAFAVKLRQGTSPVTDTKYNLGLAVRLGPGESLRNKYAARKMANNLYLLYGPSVDQVFRAGDGEGVATDMIPQIGRDLEKEFLRLIGVDL